MKFDPPTPQHFASFLIHHNEDDSVEIKREIDGDIQDIGIFPNLESAEKMVYAIIESEHSQHH